MKPPANLKILLLVHPVLSNFIKYLFLPAIRIPSSYHEFVYKRIYYGIVNLRMNHGKAGGLITSWVVESLLQCVPCLPKL